MKLKTDENLPVEIAVAWARRHDRRRARAWWALGRERCRREARVLVTLDVDFANALAYPPRDHPGLIVLRPQRQDKLHVLAVFAPVVPLLRTERVDQRLWIVDESRVRIRE